jgi:phosphate-selective porin OprO/OprP
MVRFRRSKIGVLLALLTLAAGMPLRAQESSEEAVREVTEIIENETQEASKNLRDSVHENLESIAQDAKTTEELKQTQAALEAAHGEAQPAEVPAEQPPAPTVAEPAPADEQITDQPPEEKSFTEFIQAIPGFLQSVPERVPFIRERELIFFGRGALDYAHYSSGATSGDSGFSLRSLRAGLAKAFPHHLSVKAEVDLTDGESNWSDLYVRYRHEKWGLFTAGNQRVAQTLVNQTSAISRTFMEEPLPAEAFGLGRRLALGWDLHKAKAGMHFNYFGPDLNGSIGDSGLAGRAYFNPTRSRFSMFHLGASVVSEKMSRKTRFSAHPESRVTSKRLVDTGIYGDIKHQHITAFEIAGANGPFMFRSEYFLATWEREATKDPTFKGFYIQSSWVLTGESFNYVQGKFVRLRPQNPRGAWELGARYSVVDLNDQTITGGKERNLTLGLNWYSPGNQFRVMSNLIFVKTDGLAGDEDPLIFQLRAQFHW